ncbi:MAG: 3-dehydroquinate synthase, partial [Oscillospiraceae bacterium]|nr:3-dehydroquinate synthase [Oscillospiraceae bacterium]
RRILSTVQALGLPSETGYPLSELCEAARADKKRRGDAITCVIPRAIGRCELRTMSFADFVRFCGG